MKKRIVIIMLLIVAVTLMVTNLERIAEEIREYLHQSTPLTYEEYIENDEEFPDGDFIELGTSPNPIFWHGDPTNIPLILIGVALLLGLIPLIYMLKLTKT